MKRIIKHQNAPGVTGQFFNLNFFIMTIIKDFNGADIDLEAYIKSLRDFPSYAKKEMSASGHPYLSNTIFTTYPCGCEIVGNGTLQFPMSIKPCKEHGNK